MRSSPAGMDAGGTRHGRRLGARSEHQPTSSDATPSVGLEKSAALTQTQKHRIAEEIGDHGAATLKTIVTDTLNQRMAPIRARRAELIKDRSHLRTVLHHGNERARTIASATLTAVHQHMHTQYLG